MRKVTLSVVLFSSLLAMGSEPTISAIAANASGTEGKRFSTGVLGSAGLCTGGIAMSARPGQAAAVGIPVAVAANLLAHKVSHSHRNIARALQFAGGAACLSFGATRSNPVIPSASNGVAPTSPGSGGGSLPGPGAGVGSGTGAGGTGSGSGTVGSGSGNTAGSGGSTGGSGSTTGGSGNTGGSGGTTGGSGNPNGTCRTGSAFDCGFPGNGGFNNHGFAGIGTNPAPGWSGK
jgi:hypothetical protein